MQKKLSISLVASVLLATTNLFSAQNLETIEVVSATNSTQSIKDVTSNVEVITKEEIEEKHFTTVTEALNTIPGISFTSNGSLGSSTSVYLRGMDSKRTLVLIDGIRYNDVTGLSGAPFEHLMISDIERIEVVKGAQSGVWGADASAGVINIITKTANTGTHGDVEVEYGSYNTKKLAMNLSHKTEKYYVKGSLNKTETDGFSSYVAKKSSVNYGKRGDELGYDDDGYDNLTANLKVGYNIDDSNKIDLAYTGINADDDFDDTASDAKNTSTTQDNFSTVSYQNKNDIATTDAYIKRSEYDRTYYYATGKTTNFNGLVNEYGIKTDIPYLNETSFLVLGADYKTFEHKNDLNEEYNNKGIFLTNSNKFNDNQTIITESLRFDDYDTFDNKTTGKIGIKQYLWSDLNVSSNYGTAYNVPTLYNLYDSYSGNKDLTPEETKSYDLQVEYQGISATYFDTKIKDMINWQSSGYTNIEGISTLKGYELAYKKDIIEDTFLNLNYTHLSAQNDNKEDLARRAKNQIGYGVDYYGISKFHFNVNGQYIGDRYDGANKTGAETGNYTVWNSVVNYQINKTFSTYLKVDNIFNKYYQTVDGYATAERSAYVGLKASF